MARTVGFIGLGSMGASMAQAILRAGHHCTGYDINEEAIATLVSKGGKAAKSVEEAAKAAQGDTLVIMVVNEQQSRDVVSEALPHLVKGTTVILMSTISPAAAVDIAAQVEAVGSYFVDAPVSGGAVRARSAELSIMASGNDKAYGKAEEILNAMGAKIYRMGNAPGRGCSMKAINQVLCGVHIAAAGEAMSLADALGVDQKLALDILSNSSASSWMLTDRGNRMLQEEPEVTSAVNLCAKDLDIVVATGRQVGSAVPLSAAALQMFTSAQGRGEGTVDDSQVVRSYDLLRGKRK